MAVYLCGICKTQLESVPKWYHEESIGCDKCPLWFHLKCVSHKKQVVLHTIPVTMGIMDIVTVNKISRLMSENPVAVICSLLLALH